MRGRGLATSEGGGPLTVLVTRLCRTKGKALRLEYAIKQLTRPQKEALVITPRAISTTAARV